MQRLKSILVKHSNWEAYNEYIVRVEGFASTDFTLCIENAKALLEGISKEVCVKKGVDLDKNSKMSGLLKTAFESLGYPSTSTILQIGTAIANVGQQMGDYSFFASEVLFSNDPKAYKNELRGFNMIPKDETKI